MTCLFRAMNKLKNNIVPQIQILPDENKHCFWKNFVVQDLRIVSSINFFKSYFSTGIILVPDINNLPDTNYLCLKSNLKIFEYYQDEPAQLAEAIDIYIKKHGYIGFIILQYFAIKTDLISSLLVSKGFEVVDMERHYQELKYSKVMNLNVPERLYNRHDSCPQCASDNLIYQEGDLICLECGSCMGG